MENFAALLLLLDFCLVSGNWERQFNWTDLLCPFCEEFSNALVVLHHLIIQIV